MKLCSVVFINVNKTRLYFCIALISSTVDFIAYIMLVFFKNASHNLQTCPATKCCRQMLSSHIKCDAGSL